MRHSATSGCAPNEFEIRLTSVRPLTAIGAEPDEINTADWCAEEIIAGRSARREAKLFQHAKKLILNDLR